MNSSSAESVLFKDHGKKTVLQNMFLLSDIFCHLRANFANLKIKVWDKTLKLIAQIEKLLSQTKVLR